MSLSPEELQRRYTSGRVWASDVGTVLGVNPYETAHELALVYMGELEPEPATQATMLGDIWEEAIGRTFERLMGMPVRRRPEELIHPDHPLGCHLDFEVEATGEPLECKNVGWRMAGYWGEPGTDQIADYYLPQIVTQVMLTGAERGHVAAMIGGDPRFFVYDRDRELEPLIADACHEFLERVAKRDPPPLDPEHDTALELLKRKYRRVALGMRIHLPPSIQHWHTVREEALAKLKLYSAAVDAARAHIIEAMGEAEFGYLPDGGGYSRKVVTRKAYEVEATEYIDLRYKTKAPEVKE